MIGWSKINERLLEMTSNEMLLDVRCISGIKQSSGTLKSQKDK